MKLKQLLPRKFLLEMHFIKISPLQTGEYIVNFDKNPVGNSLTQKDAKLVINWLHSVGDSLDNLQGNSISIEKLEGGEYYTINIDGMPVGQILYSKYNADMVGAWLKVALPMILNKPKKESINEDEVSDAKAEYDKGKKFQDFVVKTATENGIDDKYINLYKDVAETFQYLTWLDMYNKTYANAMPNDKYTSEREQYLKKLDKYVGKF